MALMGLMQNLLVEQTGEVDPDDLAEGIAIGQILPGPVAVDCATHLGYRLRGIVGAFVTTGSLVAPAFLLMLVVTPLYLRYGAVPQVAGFFHGVGPAVVAVILAAAWRLGKRFIADYGAGVIAALAFAGTLFKVNPVLVILAAGILGIVVRNGLQEPSAGEQESK